MCSRLCAPLGPAGQRGLRAAGRGALLPQPLPPPAHGLSPLLPPHPGETPLLSRAGRSLGFWKSGSHRPCLLAQLRKLPNERMMTRLPPQGASALGHLARAPRSSVRVAPSLSLPPSWPGDWDRQGRLVREESSVQEERRGAVEPFKGRWVCRCAPGPTVPTACTGLGPGGGRAACRELCREAAHPGLGDRSMGCAQTRGLHPTGDPGRGPGQAPMCFQGPSVAGVGTELRGRNRHGGGENRARQEGG